MEDGNKSTNKLWYTIEKEKVEEILEVKYEDGLSMDQASERLKKYGPNEIGQGKKRSIIAMITEQFKDFMVLILLVAAIISGILGEYTDSIIIVSIIVLNAVLGIVQESKAEASLAALKEMAAPHAKVFRSGKPEVIPSSQLVIGDVVVLEAGDMVPADIRLFESPNLSIQEAALTGESVPVQKDGTALFEDDIPLGDRVNMAYSGSIVTYGRGRGIVVGTGMDTEMGKIANMISEQDKEKTPLQQRLSTLSKTMGVAVILICVVIYIIGILYGKDLFKMFLTSVSLAVAAIPEGLLAIVTIVLAIGVQRMSKRNAIIRKLPAVETLGSATVICSDKTGTLTQNKMTVQKVYINNRLFDTDEYIDELTDNIDMNLLITIGVYCNDAHIKEEEGNRTFIGDPTETAIVDFGLKAGINKEELDRRNPRVDEMPFDSDRKLMTTVHNIGNKYRIFTKGALDELLDRCTHILLGNEIMTIDTNIIQEIQKVNVSMASQALRVLAMAYKDEDELVNASEFEKGLIFVGMVGMIDPPREEAKEAIKLCKRAGIKPVMITGDHKTTAIAIAKELGMLDNEDEAISGSELEKMDDNELKNNVKNYSVYARVSPEHKVRIVKAWQSWGQVVAMTGDGVNDAPALKRSDIGAAMGRTGTDVAKEAADMVLTDDNFATIVSAVEEGRRIYSNILKCIQYLLSCNVGEILVLFIATLLNWSEPLLPIHILWVNLVTDSLPAFALGVEPAEPDIMDRKPRSTGNSVFSKGLIISIAYQGAMIGALTLVAFTIGNKYSLAIAETMTFAVLAFSQIVHGINVRSSNKSIFKIGLFSNKYYLGAASISIILQLLIMNIPFMEKLFKVVPLNQSQWIIVIALSLTPLIVVELIKLFTSNNMED